ncbi:MAG: hypothetical protein JW820_03830 [Spirochaetales bacterium]|nr:hypothetical protein [Spirochaetales bacterium]
MEKTEQAAISAGWGFADVTPKKTMGLYGQYYQRTAAGVRDPLSVTALALEQPASGASGQAILISCDQVFVERPVVESLRERLRRSLPDFDPSRLIVSATHTHCGPTSSDPLQWWKANPAVLSPEEFRVTLVEGMEAAAVQAWRGRQPALVGAAAGYASVGHCRRALYLDGSAEMYGATDRPDFAGMESGEDDTVGVLAFWTMGGSLTGLLVNVVCPSQVMEATYEVTADMFGEMRRRLGERYGSHLRVLCQIGAAGDISPRDLTRPHRQGPTYWDEEGLLELGARLADAVVQALPQAEASRRDQAVFRHEVRLLNLPIRTVSAEDYARAAAELAALEAREPADSEDPGSAYRRFVEKTLARERQGGPGPYDDKNDDFVLMRNLEGLIERFQNQRRHASLPTEVHVLRLGDLALSTSPFELYLDYGLRIRARSPAALTLHAQLTCGELGYLPTARAAAAGGYGALVANGKIGPEGGQLLVEGIVETLRQLFAD